MFNFIRYLWVTFRDYIVLLLILIFSLYLISINDNPGIKNFRSFWFGTFAIANSVINKVIPSFTPDDRDAYLRMRNAELMLENNELRRFALQKNEIEKLIQFKDSSRYKLLPATIIERSIQTDQRRFVIDCGNTHGVKVGMPVITDQGLVGIINLTSDHYSYVNTLKTNQLRLVVQEERSRLHAVLKWNGEKLLLTNIVKTANITPGDRIVTSSASTIVKSSIPIGRIKQLINPDQGLLYNAEVEPFANLEKIEHVFILIEQVQKSESKLPQ